MPPKELSLYEGIKYPSLRDETMDVNIWIKSKKLDDGAEGLWRIHDGIYDLTTFIDKHPGGKMWLNITKGTDVTEAFESHHITTAAEKILPKYFVRQATTPRNSPYTFKPNGFYKTLKTRVQEYLGNKRAPISLTSRILIDIIVVSLLVTSVLAGKFSSFYLAGLSGFLMAMIVTVGHNFVHMGDNWRMYYYPLSSFSIREWRISHGLSHHLHTNSIQDLEISLMEPFLQFLPQKDKSLIARYGSWLYFSLFNSSFCFMQAIRRFVQGTYENSDFIIFVVPFLMFISGDGNLFTLLFLWFTALAVCGFFFGGIGFTAAHHHPDIFHEGDLPRVDRDWGLHQIDTVQDRVEIKGFNLLTLTIFGEHTLHHLFPTIDHVYLSKFDTITKETFEEFGVDSNVNTIWELFLGTFKQLARTEVNTKERKQKKII